MADHARYLVEDGDLEINSGRPTVTLAVANSGDRPIQVGSHAHFFEVNRALRLDRAAAFGMRLDIPAGTAVRFEPGQQQTVTLVAFGGARYSERRPCSAGARRSAMAWRSRHR